MDLFIKIAVKDEASDKVSKIAGGIGNGLKAAASVGVAAVSVAASGIAALTTAAVKNYAEYEQLVGGVETLFKDSAGMVQQYAADAYKTAGISANEYMSTVTSFSASLLQSLGGDTEAAADLADRALRDMSDNANKMGTDMQTIIATYQSLSRGNYAMLDNLKLGYGGTKAEMERLIATAAKTNSAVKAGDMSFANMVLAIGEIQEEMGIMGTTAIEAATTISGSVASMKAAWQNLLVGVADDNADFEMLINNFVESAGTAAENVLPRITVALNGAARLISSLLPHVLEQLPALITTTLPQMTEAAINIIKALVDGLSQNGETIMNAVVDVFMILSSGILEMLPQIVELGLQLIIALANGIAENAPTLIPAITECILLISDVLLQNAPLLIICGMELISQILVGMVESFPLLTSWVIELPLKIKQILDEHGSEMVDSGMNMVNNIMQGFVVAWNSFSLMVKGLVNQLLAYIHNAITSIPGAEGLLNTLGFDGPLSIDTTFEENKIRDAKREMGLYTAPTNINITAVQQTPGQIKNAVTSALELARW